MFSTLGLFAALACPDRPACTRPHCLYSHAPNLPEPRPLLPHPALIPAKRPAPTPDPTPRAPVAPEPPRKLLKLGPTRRPTAVPSSSSPETSVPVLRVNAAQSLVPIPVRQTMLKTLYDHFSVLYQKILSSSPALPTEHALKQEDQVYRKSNKVTYRNAIIQSVAALKRRPIPTSLNHPSVGTEDDISERLAAEKQIQSLHLSRQSLQHLVHSLDELQKWGYIVQVPNGPGGDQPAMDGRIVRCDRCTQYYLVKPPHEADQCAFHWGKPYTTRIGGDKIRMYNCCSRPVSDGEPCSRGPHVFYESDPETLHARHPFSSLWHSDVSQPQKLDVAALDCEMVYTTGGMRVARVSVIDGMGKEVFDHFVQMDDGVQVIDFNTRFSGVTADNLASATMNLVAIRDALDSMIDANTILIGHALDNDLKTLRIIHHTCIDTALLFPHRAGKPYRRSLRDLVREKLGKMIQTGGETEGHSSVEDAAATLDLVRWYILNKQKSAVESGVEAIT